MDEQKAEEFMELKRKVDLAKTEQDQAAGSMATVMEQLQEDFGCKTIEAAQEKMTTLKESLEGKEAAFTEALEEFQEKWEESVTKRDG